MNNLNAVGNVRLGVTMKMSFFVFEYKPGSTIKGIARFSLQIFPPRIKSFFFPGKKIKYKYIKNAYAFHPSWLVCSMKFRPRSNFENV